MNDQETAKLGTIIGTIGSHAIVFDRLDSERESGASYVAA